MKIKKYSIITIYAFDNDTNNSNNIIQESDDKDDAMSFYEKALDRFMCIDGITIAIKNNISGDIFQHGVWYGETKLLKPSDLFNGLLVKDSEGNNGVVRDCVDLHNVHITFEGEGILIDVNGEEIECGGSSLYCFIEGCEEFSPNVDHLFFR